MTQIQQETSEGVSPATSHHKRRVLLVEDNQDGREALATLLGIWNFEVISAEDGLQALELSEENHPDIAILDIGLPGLDGYEVARRLRERDEAQPYHLIALTGYGQPKDRAKALAAGFDMHLVKPVDPSELRRILLEL
jgi:two-component system, sensor histidine kinase